MDILLESFGTPLRLDWSLAMIARAWHVLRYLGYAKHAQDGKPIFKQSDRRNELRLLYS